MAAGADAVIVEVHPNPEAAFSDGRQSLTLEGFDAMFKDLQKVAQAVGKKITRTGHDRLRVHSSRRETNPSPTA